MNNKLSTENENKNVAHAANMKRRDFMKSLLGSSALWASAVVIMPTLTACTSKAENANKSAGPGAGKAAAADVVDTGAAADSLALPLVQPQDWDVIAFNTKRALAGAAPASYHAAIKSADGATKQVGKHLPYLPSVPASQNIPAGYVAVMFGDASKEYARHPASAAVPELDDTGHWFDWITIRKATAEDAELVKSTFSDWPTGSKDDNGKLASFTGTALDSNKGKDCMFLAQLPKDVQPGDTIRVNGHCNKHGDWVEFFTL